LIELHLPDVTSTNDYAKELLRTHPAVFVTALHQTAGRGRNGKDWLGDYGLNAYCSVGLAHGGPVSVDEAASYMGRGALSVINALRAVAPSQTFRLKYPNDVQGWTGGQWAKIAGTLVEHEYMGDRCTSTVIGMGVNIGQKTFPENIAQPSTSLFLLGSDISLGTFMDILKGAIERYLEIPWRNVHDEWCGELDLEGMEVRVVGAEGRWKVRQVLADGRLEVQHTHTHTTRVLTDGDSIRYDDRAE